MPPESSRTTPALPGISGLSPSTRLGPASLTLLRSQGIRHADSDLGEIADVSRSQDESVDVGRRREQGSRRRQRTPSAQASPLLAISRVTGRSPIGVVPAARVLASDSSRATGRPAVLTAALRLRPSPPGRSPGSKWPSRAASSPAGRWRAPAPGRVDHPSASTSRRTCSSRAVTRAWLMAIASVRVPPPGGRKWVATASTASLPSSTRWRKTVE